MAGGGYSIEWQGSGSRVSFSYNSMLCHSHSPYLPRYNITQPICLIPYANNTDTHTNVYAPQRNTAGGLLLKLRCHRVYTMRSGVFFFGKFSLFFLLLAEGRYIYCSVLCRLIKFKIVYLCFAHTFSRLPTDTRLCP